MASNSSIWDKYEDVSEQFRNRNNPSGMNSPVQSSGKPTGSIWDKYEDVSSQLGRMPSMQSGQQTSGINTAQNVSDEWANAPEGIRTARQRDLDRQQSLPENASTFDRFKSYIGAPVTEQQYADRNARVLGAADAATLGFADEIYGGAKALPQALFGSPESFARTYAENRDVVRDATRNARENNSSNYTSGSIAGVLGTAALPLGAVARGAGLARQVGTGAKIGALAGFGGSEGDDLTRLASDTLSGAGIGAVGGALGAGAGRAISGAANAAKGAVTRIADRNNPLRKEEGLNIAFDALKKRANEGYEQARQSNLVLNQNFTQDLKNDVSQYLQNKGFNVELQPKIASVIRSIDNLGSGEVTVSQLDNLRKIAGNVASSENATERMMATRIKNLIDDRLEKATPNQVVSGNLEQATTGLRQARKDYSTRSRYQDISDAIDSAELRASTSGQGGNRQNAIRQDLRRVLQKGKGFSEEERRLLTDIVKGTPTTNTLRALGKFSPSTGNLQSTAASITGIGGLTGAISPFYSIPSTIGLVAKPFAERSVDNGVNTLLRTILNNGERLPETLPALSSPLQQLIRDYLSSAGAIQSREYNR